VTGVVFLFGTLAVTLWLARKFLRNTDRPKCRHAPLQVLDGTVDGVCWSCGETIERLPHA
jgi:hypothetical protein